MNVGVLASHEGTTLQSLMDAFASGRVQGRVAVVVSNNGEAGALSTSGPKAFEGRILNTHPALLPRFGGPGMYGDRVFEAVLEAGETESGISIHHVDAEYDTGAIVRQCRVPVYRGDSLDNLKARVRAREKEFVIETLEKIAKGEIPLVAGT